MDASLLPPELIRELEALRRRAYGLGADIDADPVALQRLRELESAQRSNAPIATDEAPGDGVTSEAATVVRSDARHLVAERGSRQKLFAGAEPDELLDPVRRSPAGRPDRRLPSSIRATVVAVTVIVVLGWVTSMLSTPRTDTVLTAMPSSQQERQDLIDEVDLATFGMVGAHLRAFTGFHELSVWSASSGSGMTCLLVQSDGGEVLQMGCTPAPLQPSIDLRVGDQVSPDLVGGLPAGSVVRFALRGGQVGVWTAEATGVSR